MRYGRIHDGRDRDGFGSRGIVLSSLLRDTGDRLFFMFAISFLLLGATRLGLAFSHDTIEGQTHWYWVRLAAFVLILVAIVDKNRR